MTVKTKAKALRALVALLLCAVMLSAPLSAVYAAEPTPYYLDLEVEGRGVRRIRAYEESYRGNLYLSLADLSAAFDGSAKQFRFEYNSGEEAFFITTGRPAAAAVKGTAVEKSSVAYLDISRNRLFVDGGERRYYTYRSGSSDLYMSLTDVQLVLDVEILFADGALYSDPDSRFAPDIKELRRGGYFDAINAAIVGDAQTGELIFYHSGAFSYPIASLSKLMSYLLLCEAADRGEISFDDVVTIPVEAAELSHSADGMISMSTGEAVPFRELVSAMLLASSNEAAEALAIHAAGSEEAFVERMNSRARELGMLSARFYSPHGLPVYSASPVPAKRQNMMSANDMFLLCAYILENYPQITEITSLQYARLSRLNYSTANTNTLVFNVSGVTGLKTGSTNRAGYCVTASMPIERDGETHDIILVILGAETPDLRGQAGEILLRYAKDYYSEHDFRG